MDKNLQRRIDSLEQKLKTLEQKYSIHQHNNTDGTNMLRKNIMLDRDQWLAVGTAQVITQQPKFLGTAEERHLLSISCGPDSVDTGVVYKSKNIQMDFVHLTNTDGTSRIRAFAKPLVVSYEGTTVSTTAAGNTITITGYNFVTNELVGAFINISNSSGVLVETQTIASNTSTVITISGTWLNSTSNGTFLIYRPVGLGDQTVNFKIAYVGEGTSAGIRFGVGATSNGQNGLLYMDAAGDLYWRTKAGAVTKLN